MTITNPSDNTSPIENYKEIRSQYARSLKEAKNTEERKKLLDTIKISDEYLKSLQAHTGEKTKLKEDRAKIGKLAVSQKSNNFKTCFAEFYGRYFRHEDKKNKAKKELTADEYKEIYGYYEDEKSDGYHEYMFPLEILKKTLAGKTLIDLGCGGPQSTLYMYELAARNGTKEYIGVDKYPESEQQINVDYFRKKNPEIKTIPTAKVVQSDMLEFLNTRTKPACFVMNGIDEYILDDGEYIKKLLENIARLTLSGDVIFGMNNNFIRKLQYLGFKEIYTNGDGPSDLTIWEKV